MRRIGIIFWQTYWGTITQRTFLIFVLGLPLLGVFCALAIGAAGALFITLSLPPTNERPIGVVDETASPLFAEAAEYPDTPVPFVRYEELATAEAALAEGEIQAYFVLTADFWETGLVPAAYDPATPPSPTILNGVEGWLRGQVRAGIDPDILRRLAREPVFVPYGGPTAEGETEEPATRPPRTPDEEMDAWIVFFAIIYLGRMASMLTSGYMYDIIASESRNRTIEILLTSTNTYEFIIGRVAGLLLVGFTHLLVWGGAPLLLLATGPFADLGDWEHIRLMVSLLLGGYLLDQMLGATGGILRVTGGAGPQLFNLLGWFSILTLVYAGYFIGRAPDSTLAVIASLVPFSSPIVLLTRLLYGPVPLWQIIAAQLSLWLTLAGFVLVLGRLLRRNLVAYPSRFNLWQWAKKLVMSNE